jgi:hypothetical protein
LEAKQQQQQQPPPSTPITRRLRQRCLDLLAAGRFDEADGLLWGGVMRLSSVHQLQSATATLSNSRCVCGGGMCVWGGAGCCWWQCWCPGGGGGERGGVLLLLLPVEPCVQQLSCSLNRQSGSCITATLSSYCECCSSLSPVCSTC